ncbi:MAG: ImmA/IrrE family metallo-endopeptidase [Proteobacteria bacterium]|nr:ImmA/IrrE family metallo-endopeptidase [Pseudomonadota bacterium]
MGDDLPFRGEQLRLARLAFGYSLDELGVKVGATRQFVHQLEIGAKVPSRDLVVALAAALGVTPRFFSASARATVRPEQCHFRKQAATPASVTSQVLARGSILDTLTEELDNRLDLPRVDFPDFAATSLDEVEAVAEAAREHWGLGKSGPITNMMRVVENAGAIVTYFDGVSDRVDALSMDRRRPIIVRSEAKQSLCRLRFDLAHECGHLIMHRGIQTGDRLTEDQANRFASAFLLPRSPFLHMFPRSRFLNWELIFHIKLNWKVSARAILRRALDLGVITPGQYRTGNVHLAKTGQTKIERYDADLQMEQAELLDVAIDTLGGLYPGAVSEFASELGLGKGMFDHLTSRELDAPVIASVDSKVRYVDFTARRK